MGIESFPMALDQSVNILKQRLHFGAAVESVEVSCSHGNKSRNFSVFLAMIFIVFG